MEELVKLAKSVLGQDPGISLLLFILCGLAMWAYWKEKQKSEVISEQRLEEARQDVKLITETLSEMTGSVRDFKESNDSLKAAFESLANTTKNNQDTIQTLVGKLKG
jgi:FtsZ-binding cell division protein ZapB